MLYYGENPIGLGILYKINGEISDNMKLLLSLLTLPTTTALVLSGICAGGCRYALYSGILQGADSKTHIMRGVVYILIGCGLPLAVYVCAGGVILMVLGFIFKSWYRAATCGIFAVLGFLLWKYYLSIPYFLVLES